jgi:hypothetical protein
MHCWTEHLNARPSEQGYSTICIMTHRAQLGPEARVLGAVHQEGDEVCDARAPGLAQQAVLPAEQLRQRARLLLGETCNVIQQLFSMQAAAPAASR